jgi:uncharacterized protein YuzE
MAERRTEEEHIDVNYSFSSDALYVARRDVIVESIELYGSRISIDLNAQGKVLGVMVLRASKGMSKKDFKKGRQQSITSP